MRISLMFAGVALTLGTAQAQFGAPTGMEIPVETIVANNGCLGVCRTEVNGQERFWVSARAPGSIAGNPHLLYEFDRQGNLLGTYNQPTVYTTTNVWGIRDMAFDGQYIYGGQENTQTLPNPNTVYAFDPVSRTYVHSADIVLIAPAFPTTRALAFNPVTNRFYTSNFGGAAYEFDRTGAVLSTITSTAGAMYGAGYDLAGNAYWQFGQTGAHTTNYGTVFNAYDLNTGLGNQDVNKTYGDITHNTSGAPNVGGIAGGMETYYRNGKLYAISLTQGTPDSIVEIALDLNSGTTCSAGGSGPAGHTLSGGAPWSGNAAFNLNLVNAPGLAGGISLLFLSAPGAFPIPLPAPFGAGCNLLLSPSPLIFMGNSVVGPNGSATYPLPLPAGLPIHTGLAFQSIILNAVFSAGATSQLTQFATK